MLTCLPIFSVCACIVRKLYTKNCQKSEKIENAVTYSSLLLLQRCPLKIDIKNFTKYLLSSPLLCQSLANEITRGTAQKVFVFRVILVRIFPYSFRMRENADQHNSEYGHFLRSGDRNISFLMKYQLLEPEKPFISDFKYFIAD